MDHRVPIAGAVAAIVAALAAVASFLFLNGKFDGPSPLSGIGSKPYELVATFDDSENLPTKQAVLSHGVEVGTVTDVHYDRGANTGTVKFTVDGEFAPVYRDATVRIGERTILGDPFLDLDRGHGQTGEAPGGAEIKALPSVDFDEALSFLDAKGRGHLRSLLHTVAQGAATEGNGARLNGTVGGLYRTLVQLQRVTGSLSGQEEQISSIAQNGATVLGVLGDREASIRQIVGSGRRTLDGLASDTASVQAGIGELPALLSAGRASLRDARPLFADARPVMRRLRDLAPKLRPALKEIGPISGDTAAVISGLTPLRRASIPFFARTHEALVVSKPVIERLDPAVRNLQPILAYLAPRSQEFVSFFSNLASATAHGDSNGRWARFNLNPVPGELLGGPGGLPTNPYPAPGDANDNQPYVPGSYQRTYPWDPPPRP